MINNIKNIVFSKNTDTYCELKKNVNFEILSNKKTEFAPKKKIINSIIINAKLKLPNNNINVKFSALGGLRTGSNQVTYGSLQLPDIKKIIEILEIHQPTLQDKKTYKTYNTDKYSVNMLGSLYSGFNIFVGSVVNSSALNEAYRCYLAHNKVGMKVYLALAGVNINFANVGFKALKLAKIAPNPFEGGLNNFSLSSQQEITVLRDQIIADVITSNFGGLKNKLLSSGMTESEIAYFIKRVKDEKIDIVNSASGELGQSWNSFKIKTLLTAHKIAKQFSIPYVTFLERVGTSSSTEAMIKVAMMIKIGKK